MKYSNKQANDSNGIVNQDGKEIKRPNTQLIDTERNSKILRSESNSIQNSSSSESIMLIDWGQRSNGKNKLLNGSTMSINVGDFDLISSVSVGDCKHSFCERMSSTSSRSKARFPCHMKIIDVGLRSMSKISVKEKILNENVWIFENSFEVTAMYTVRSSSGAYVNIDIVCDEELSGALLKSGFIYSNEERRNCYRKK